MAETEHESPPDLADETEHDSAASQTAGTATEPQGLKADKKSLSSGDSWMEIKMGDTDGHDLEAYDPETSHRLAKKGADRGGGSLAKTEGEEMAAEAADIPGGIPDDQQGGEDDNTGIEGGQAAMDSPTPEDAEEASVVQDSAALQQPATVQSDVQLNHQRVRSESRSTTNTAATQRSTPVSSAVFVVTALDTIGSSKDARKNKQLDDAVQKALANIKLADQQGIDPEVIFRPLQLATKTFSIPLQTTALDCIGKLITYSYFAFPSSQLGTGPNGEAPSEEPPLIERAIETICDCFENEATPVEIQQQIIKSLLAAVLNDKIVVHGAGLLKAVRQIYNIFIYSKSSTNQQVAQGSLTQMVGTVFERVRTRLAMKEARMNLSKIDHDGSAENQSEDNLASETLSLGPLESNGGAEVDGPEDALATPLDQPTAKVAGEKLTLQSFETSKNLDDAVVNDNAPTMVTRAKKDLRITRSASGVQEDREEAENAAEDEEDEIYVRDAFLVFRSLCKLSHKVLPPEQQQDIKSQNMRSKLLSLHLIHNLLNNHMVVFTSPVAVIKSSTNSGDPTTFMQASKPHLCLSLSRNGSSSIPRVFEVCCEIFWLMLKNLRVMLKKELEVFLKEIYLAILERRTAPVFQKQHVMDVLERLSSDPRALVEIYLNYDCDRTALDNMYQIIIEQLSRISSNPVAVTVTQQQQYQEHHLRVPGSGAEWHQRGTFPPSLATSSIANSQQNPPTVPAEYIMKQQALECLVEILRSLDNWSSQGIADAAGIGRDPASRNSLEDVRESLDTGRGHSESSPRFMSSEFGTGQSTPVLEDDPNQIEKVKQRKTALSNAIKQFNYKPKRGIKALIAEGFIPSESPEDIAQFLLANDQLDKAVIGEYLGEGEPQNIAIMHAFVDSMEFTKRRFVDALRSFLQSFRLPGEAQKIDRFMLKFAERYLGGNPNAFANADTAYVLAYSVILLNTDQHSLKMKGPRMTREDFIKNNRGINDNHDLPEEYLSGIFDEISQNEIVLKTERETAAALGLAAQVTTGGLASRAGQVFATVGRDLQKEKYAQASEEMANKTEQLYRSLIRAQRKTAVKANLTRFIPATSFKHVGPMFNVTWMSFLSGLSGQVQDSQNLEIIKLCMEGLKLAIRISCLFDLETPRVAFVTALAKFTNLGNLKEMMAKNVEALKVLLDVGLTEGNRLKSSWREVLTCVSQLDRFQLLSGGVDESSIPDVSKARIVTPSNADGSTPRRSAQGMRKPRPRSTNSATYQPEVAMESRSAEMIRGVDRIFTNTANLSTEAIIDFIRGLSDVSWQEIQSSGQSESPRTYSLQKLVEISYYNMTRVRIEWTKIWEVLGEHFVQVGCHTNTAVVYFALDSLRQLSMRFMEIEELPGFKFQKDFLKPFEHVMVNTNVVAVKDMVLRCLIQMIQARGDNIRSGWRTMFGVFTVAAKEPHEAIVRLAFEHVSHVYNNRFGVVISQGAFADLIVCLTEFSKNLKFQKVSLQAIETLKSTIPKMLRTPECPLSYRHGKSKQNGASALPKQPNPQTQEEQFWYPVLIAFQDVLMTGEDLEVRSRALTYLFETLVRYGGDFPPDFWDILWRQLLYPIFVVLQSKSEMSKVPNHEDLSVWLSTTMIQALRNMITLFTHYFESLEWMLDRFLNLLILCICQENDTIARIGSNCLQQLILQNVTKFRIEHWTKIVGAFVELFNRTTAYELFSAAAPLSGPPASHDARMTSSSLTPSISEFPSVQTPTSSTPPLLSHPRPNGIHLTEQEATESPVDSSATTLHGTPPPALETPTPDAPEPELEDYRPPSPVQQQPVVVTAARRRFFNKIITNCVLQLLMIETVNELFSNDAVYAQIPSPELLRLMGLLKSSYQFAKKFNSNKELRMRLWREGFMKQPPNLLKQESGSAATYVNILVRMYHDEGEERKSSRAETEEALVPLCADIIRSYVGLDEETQQRNIIAWRPVVVDVMEGYTNFPRDTFEKHIETFYPLAVELLSRDLAGVEIRLALQSLLRRIGEVRMGMPPFQTPLATPTSPRNIASSFPIHGGRRASRGR